MTEDELPREWTDNYGGFVTIGDLVMATCRRCLCCVFSDFFDDHTARHNTMTFHLTSGLSKLL